MSRTGVWLFIVCVWGVQILWSKAWLTRFRFGPIEWVWRCATYDHDSLSCGRHLKINIKVEWAYE